MFCYFGQLCLLLLFYSLIRISQTARYYFKLLVFTVGAITAAFFATPWFIIRPRDYRNALWPAWGCRWLSRALGVTFEVRGIENIRRDHGSVVLMNHQSLIDLTVLAYLWPLIGRATVVSKKEMLYVFPFGQAAYLWGTLFIDRADKSAALGKLNKETEAIQKHAAKLLIFPEGTRNSTDKFLPFKKGAFHIAVQSQATIQPVVTSKYRFLDSKKKFFGTGHNIIHILPEISCKGLTKDDIPALLERTQRLMEDEYDKLNARMTEKAKND